MLLTAVLLKRLRWLYEKSKKKSMSAFEHFRPEKLDELSLISESLSNRFAVSGSERLLWPENVDGVYTGFLYIICGRLDLMCINV